MRIVPINNNLSLKGSFQNSELMQKAVVHATTEELVKFNEILERAHFIDDKKVFFLSERIEKRFIPAMQKEIEISNAELFCNNNGNIEQIFSINGGIGFPFFKLWGNINNSLAKLYPKDVANERLTAIDNIIKNLK